MIIYFLKFDAILCGRFAFPYLYDTKVVYLYILRKYFEIFFFQKVKIICKLLVFNNLLT